MPTPEAASCAGRSAPATGTSLTTLACLVPGAAIGRCRRPLR